MKFRIILVVLLFNLVCGNIATQKCDKEAVCTVDVNYITTFDGLHYQYQICDHILVDNHCCNKWRIVESVADNTTSRGGRILTIIQRNHAVKIYSNFSVVYEGHKFTATQANVVGSQAQEFNLFMNGDNSVYFKSLLYGFWVIFDTTGRVKIGVAAEWRGKLQGLCGDYSDDVTDDARSSDGNVSDVTHEFGDSWSTPGSSLRCERPPISPGKRRRAYEICESLIAREPLRRCTEFISADECLGTCVLDLGSCLEDEEEGKCRCEAMEKYARICQQAAPELDLTSWRRDNNCSIACPAGMQYLDCSPRRCEPRCDTLMTFERSCPLVTGECHSGCFCPEGMVRSGERCVEPQQCRDCVCTSWGSSHYITFDSTSYDHQGSCTYVASRANVSGQVAYQVLVTHGQCATGKTCASAVTVLYEGHVVILYRSQEPGKLMTATVDGSIVSALSLQNDWLSLQNNRSEQLTIFIPKVQLEVIYFYSQWSFTIRLPSYLYSSNLEGLCGNCNKNSFDDLTTSNGELVTNVDEFVTSWISQNVPPELASQTPPCGTTPTIERCLPGYPLPPAQDPCLVIMDKTKFGQCHLLVDPAPYVSACQSDMCQSVRRDVTLCGAVENYARSCRTEGLCPEWRTGELCPYKCPADKVYKSCGSTCQLTCQNYAKYKTRRDYCGQAPSEGCFCADGDVMSGDKCVKPDTCKDCVCGAWGDPHYTSFDGRKFDFQGKCTFVGARDKIQVGQNYTFQVLVTNKPCLNLRVTCTLAVTVLYDNHVIHVSRVDGSNAVTTHVDGGLVTSYPMNTTWLRLENTKKTLVTVYIPEIHLEVSYTSLAERFSIRLASHLFQNGTEGLCGPCNMDVSDDLMLRNGSVTSNINVFGMDWRVEKLPPGVSTYNESCQVKPAEPPPCKPGYPLPPSEDPCLWIMDEKFAQCHSVVDPEPYVSACQFDMCHTDVSKRQSQACGGVEAFMDECRSKGVCLTWRSTKMCPLRCSNGTVYKACGLGCVTTCDNYMTFKSNPETCGLDPVEGCFCPDGEVMKLGVCVPESACSTCELAPSKCGVVNVQPSSVGGTLTLTNKKHGRCLSKDPQPSWQVCSGFCGLGSPYVLEHECCSPREVIAVKVTMVCEDNFQFTHNVDMPKNCGCNSTCSTA